MNAPYINEFTVSIYTSRHRLGKYITRGSGGAVTKRSLGQLAEGTVKAVAFKSLRDFAAMRECLTPKQALGYGLTGHPSARVVTKAALAASSPAERDVPTVARDSQHLHFPDGPGLLMLDHDPAPGETALTAEQLRAALCEAMPELRGVTMVWASSAGSMIYAGDEEVIGLRGSRLYFVVSDARRIPEIGQLLFDRLAIAGHGRITISGAGSMLRRGLIDVSVWQPERLDFVRASCGAGLKQHPAHWRLFPGDEVDLTLGESLLDVATLVPLTAAETVRLKEKWAELSISAKPEADRKRHEWAVERVEADVKKLGTPIDSAARAIRVSRYEASARDRVLDLDHPLTLEDGREITVADLRNFPDLYDGARMADPLEPEYGGGDKRIAGAYLLREGGKKPAIHSHAHGGTWYLLRDAGEDFGSVDEGAAPRAGTGGAQVPTA